MDREMNGVVKEDREMNGVVNGDREKNGVVKGDRETNGVVKEDREKNGVVKGDRETNGVVKEEDKMNGTTNTNGTDAGEKIQTEQKRRVIYKAKESANPSLDLGVYGKIPLHTLCEKYLDTADGGTVVMYEAKCSRSIGGWVYDGAACLAKYLESLHYQPCDPADPADPNDPRDPPAPAAPHRRGRGCMSGKRVVELGAGTGVVGLVAGYHGADAVITDLETIVPLIAYNVRMNSSVLKGAVTAVPLNWGDAAPAACLPPPDYLVLANCVYYESSFEPLLATMRALASEDTEVLVVYEERTEGIKHLIARWHALVEEHFRVEYLPEASVCAQYHQDYVRLVRMKRR